MSFLVPVLSWKTNLLKLLVNFSCFIRRTMEFKSISTLVHWPNAWRWQGSFFSSQDHSCVHFQVTPWALLPENGGGVTDCKHPHMGFHQLTIIWRHRPKSDTTGKTPCSYQTLQELWKWSTYSTRPFHIIVAEQVLFCSLQIPESLLSSWRGAGTAASTKRLTAVIHAEVFPAGADCKHWKNAGGLFRQKGSFFPFFSLFFFFFPPPLLICPSCGGHS